MIIEGNQALKQPLRKLLRRLRQSGKNKFTQELMKQDLADQNFLEEDQEMKCEDNSGMTKKEDCEMFE